MPEYSAQFIGPLATALHTRLLNCLNDYVGQLGDDLDLFVEYEEPVVIAPRLPALFVAPLSSKIAQADDDSYLIEQHEIAVEFAIAGRSAHEINNALPRYMTAFDRCIRRMIQDDWYVMDATRGPVIMEITDHTYMLRKFETALRGEGQLLVTIQHMEL